MTYYPAYAFFETDVAIGAVLQNLSSNLQPEFASPEQLQDIEGIGGIEYRMTDSVNEILLSCSGPRTVSIEFWDFDPDVYDDDGPTPEMVDTKRRTALTMLSTLVGVCGASLAYLSSAPDNFTGHPSHADFADVIAACLAQGDSLIPSLRRHCYFWLFASREPELQRTIAQHRTDWDILESESGEMYKIYEDTSEQPAWMQVP